MDTSDFDVRLPLHGEPEEIVGPTLHARDALAVGSARIEPLESLASRADTFNRARYELRLEDRTGKCQGAAASHGSRTSRPDLGNHR